jgi:glycosyltransferase involved in cell wall biosynthesis
MMAVSVSVIVPTYNRAALLARCLVSLTKSGVSDLEILVVDDGSTDDTAVVVQSFNGVVYLRQANAGPAVARNHGFAASHGRYVAFLDSDDEWIAGGPARLIQQLDANADLPLVFADTLMGSPVTGFVSFVTTYGGDRFLSLPHDVREGGVRVFERRAFFQLESTRNVMFLGSLLVRRDFFDELGRFDPRLRGTEDWEFFMRASSGARIGFSEGAAVSRYFKHEGGMTTDTDHMEKEFILALDAVSRRCSLDAPDRKYIEGQLRNHLFGWAYLAYDRGDLGVARERLQWANELRQMGPREAVYLAATYLPPRVVQALRRARQALAR